MKKIVGVQTKENSKVIYVTTDNNIKIGLNVLFEAEKGMEFGSIVTETKTIDEDISENDKNIIRIASQSDYNNHLKNLSDSKKALDKAVTIAKNLKLDMQFLEANYTFDRNQLIFSFTSPARVDFRDLAKQLAGIYKTRIELRQVGVRDKAKEVSGIGSCGRELCCSCFLKDLDSVSITMAKNQNLALNPTKINGLCGRLLCCLNYEDELYKENKVDMPYNGQKIDIKEGSGTVVLVDIPNRRYIVNIPNVGKVEVKLPSKCEECEERIK